MSITHAFVSAIADDAISAAAGEVLPQTHWNAAHTIAPPITLTDIADPSTSTLTLTGGTALTTSHPVLNMTQGWNAVGITFTGLKFAVTSTASAAASLLVDLTVGGTSMFTIRKDGSPTIPNKSQFYYGTVIGFQGDTAKNNFFDGGAGNITATGTDNFGTGVDALLNLSTGTGNCAFGTNCLKQANSANSNVAVGRLAGSSLTDGSLNVVMGQGALQTSLHASSNVAVGDTALNVLNSVGNEDGSVAVGSGAMAAATSAVQGVAIGYNASSSATSISSSTAIGASAFANCTGSFCVAIGRLAGNNVTSGNYNTLIGGNTGNGITTGSGNVVIGTGVTSLAAALTDNIIIGIGNGGGNVLRYDGVNIWDFQNAANAQRFNIYNTYTSSTNYERGVFDWVTVANVLSIGTEKGSGGGATRNLQLVIAGVNKLDYGITVAGAWAAASGFYTSEAAAILHSKTTITAGSTANVPTLTTGPVTGNPTKWLPYDDNGTTRYIPSW